MTRRTALAAEERECGGGCASSYARFALHSTQCSAAKCDFKERDATRRGTATGGVTRYCVVQCSFAQCDTAQHGIARRRPARCGIMRHVAARRDSA